MDWGLKDSGWDFTELIGSSSLGVHKNGGGFSIDLKLGGLGDLDGGSLDKLKEPRGSTSSSSPSASSKRTRVMSGNQSVSCLVDGCTADLSSCRDYYRRHRVCERHSKTPLVLIGGKEQRFCQQCSRFQSLGEFDEKKRSCRKRLDGHNRRRRKPQPEAFYMSSGSYWSDHQGAKLLCFNGPQADSTSTAGPTPTWAEVSKHSQGSHVTNQQFKIPSSLACTYGGGDKRFPFLPANDPERGNQAVPEVSICQRLVNNSAQKILPDCFTHPVNSKRALSLLSPHPTQTLETSLSHLLHPDVIHSDQSIGTSLHYDGLVQFSYSQGVVEKPPRLVPQGSNLCNKMFQVAPDDLLEKGASQVLPFSWK